MGSILNIEVFLFDLKLAEMMHGLLGQTVQFADTPRKASSHNSEGVIEVSNLSPLLIYLDRINIYTDK